MMIIAGLAGISYSVAELFMHAPAVLPFDHTLVTRCTYGFRSARDMSERTRNGAVGVPASEGKRRHETANR